MLKGPAGEIALVWRPDGPAPQAPPGRYQVRTTRIARESFLISSTGAPEPSFTVKDGAKLEVDDTVRFEGQVKRQGQKLQLGFSIKGADGRGLSVYKDGNRVPVTYKVLGKDGEILAHGTMNYG